MSNKIINFLQTNFANKFTSPENWEDFVINLIVKSYELPLPSVKYKFSAQVLYNQGLGPMFYYIPEILADSPEDANKQASQMANEALGTNKWLQVKIRPIG